MFSRPFISTLVAKLITTFACHMITALSFLHHPSAFLAFSIIVLIFQVYRSIFLTTSFMILKHTFRTIFSVADYTERFRANHDIPFTFFIRTFRLDLAGLGYILLDHDAVVLLLHY